MLRLDNQDTIPSERFGSYPSNIARCPKRRSTREGDSRSRKRSESALASATTSSSATTGIKLIPLADDPLDALREEFADVDRSADELRERARETALDEAGR